MLRACLAICAAVLVGESDAKPITPSQLVGTWQPSAPDMLPYHGRPIITLRRDHTYTYASSDAEYRTFAHDTWELRGRELVTRSAGVVFREVVLSVTRDQFKARSRGTIFTYTRVKAN